MTAQHQSAAKQRDAAKHKNNDKEWIAFLASQKNAGSNDSDEVCNGKNTGQKERRDRTCAGKLTYEQRSLVCGAFLDQAMEETHDQHPVQILFAEKTEGFEDGCIGLLFFSQLK